MNNKIRLILFLIVLLGAVLRIYRLDEVPVGFHIDEAQVGYNAYSLWKTGRDETGKYLPAHLTLWKVDRPLGISYLTIPGVMLFGLNEFGTRIPTAIIGTLTIILIYLLTLQILKNRRIALVTSFFFSISPWHIILSRATSEAIGSLFFYILGTYFCFKAINKNKKLLVFWGYLAFAVSFFFYHSTRITVPFILIFFSLITFIKNRKLSLIFISFLIIYLIFPLTLFSKTSIDRFKLVSIFNAGDASLVLQEQIREDGVNLNALTSRIFHNKPVNFSLSILENFASYFSYSFLIFHGGLPIRYNVPNMGLIYLFELPILIWGVYALFKKKIGIRNIIFILLWIFLGALPASLTVEESPNINRALFMLPAIQWLTALGFLEFVELNKYFKKLKMIIFLIFTGFIIWNGGYFWHQYTVHSFTHKPWFRFYEMKELVSFITNNKAKYKTIYLTFNATEPYIYFLFYNKIDPAQLQQTIKEKGLDYIWNRKDNIKIVRLDCPVLTLGEKKQSLLVSKINCKFPKGVRVVKKFSSSDGATSLVAVDFPKRFTHEYEDLQYESENKTDTNQ